MLRRLMCNLCWCCYPVRQWFLWGLECSAIFVRRRIVHYFNSEVSCQVMSEICCCLNLVSLCGRTMDCCHFPLRSRSFPRNALPFWVCCTPKQVAPYIRCYGCFTLFLPNVWYISYPNLLARFRKAVHFSCFINQRWLVWGQIYLPFAIF